MKKISALFIIAASVLFITVLSSEPDRYEGKIVKKIEYEGLRAVTPDDINEIIRTTAGYPLKAAEVRQDLKDIFGLGSFENIDVEVQEFEDGVAVKFVLKERPAVKSIVFKGIDEFSDTDLKEAIPVKEGDILRKDYLEKGLVAIHQKYESEGFFNVLARYKTEAISGDESSVQVTYIIDEGEEIKVNKITISGARQIYVEEVKDQMDTVEDGIFRDGSFKKDVYDADKTKIIAYYKDRGYLDADILFDSVDYEWENPVDMEKRSIFITMRISEGEKYYFGGYRVKINKSDEGQVFFPEIFYPSFSLKEEGEVFDNSKFQMDRQMISFMYSSRGYIFARVAPLRTVEERDVEVDGVKEKRKFVTIEFVIDEGSKAYIESIIIKGNSKTKDKVIRRELIVKEGELFNASKVQISRERVFNLGYFKEVNFDVRPGSLEGYMNLIVDVEEQPTGTISLGGGYGTESGFSIFSDIGENNLMGNGQIVNVKFEYGPERNSITLSFTERWLLDWPVSFNTQVFYQLYKVQTSSLFPNTSESAEYEAQAFGYSLGTTYRFQLYYSIGWAWTQKFKDYLNPTGNCPDSVFMLEKKELQRKHTLNNYVFRDSRDNYMNPTRGFRTGISAAVTGDFLGGHDHFVKYSPEISAYYSPFNLPFLKTHPCVFEFRLSGDFITQPWFKERNPADENEWVEYEDRLWVGGPETPLRGWERYDYELPESWRAIGMYNRILYGLEFRIPVHPQMLWVVLFFDAGSLWSDVKWEEQLSQNYQDIVANDLESGELLRISDFEFSEELAAYFKYSYGFGFKIQIPMMPLRFWFGEKMKWNPESDKFIKFENIGDLTFQFGIGDIRY